jgi:hypothetical protein
MTAQEPRRFPSDLQLIETICLHVSARQGWSFYFWHSSPPQWGPMPIHRLWLCFHSSSFSLQFFQDPSQQLLRPDKGQSLACRQHKTGSPQLKPSRAEGESWGDGGALATYDECPNSGHTEESPGAEEPQQLPHTRSIYPPHHQVSCLSGSLAGWSTGTPSLDIAMLHPLLLSQPGLGGQFLLGQSTATSRLQRMPALPVQHLAKCTIRATGQ